MKANNFYIEDGAVVCGCGNRIKLKRFEQSGKCHCPSCGKYLPYHKILTEYKAMQRRNRERGLKRQIT